MVFVLLLSGNGLAVAFFFFFFVLVAWPCFCLHPCLFVLLALVVVLINRVRAIAAAFWGSACEAQLLLLPDKAQKHSHKLNHLGLLNVRHPAKQIVQVGRKRKP